MNRLGGARVPGDGNACKYMQLKKIEGTPGMELLFLGGSLCSGCTLLGNADGTMFSIKHNSYLQIEADDKALQPSAPAAQCKQLPRPPFFCGARGLGESQGMFCLIRFDPFRIRAGC